MANQSHPNSVVFLVDLFGQFETLFVVAERNGTRKKPTEVANDGALPTHSHQPRKEVRSQVDVVLPRMSVWNVSGSVSLDRDMATCQSSPGNTGFCTTIPMPMQFCEILYNYNTIQCNMFKYCLQYTPIQIK